MSTYVISGIQGCYKEFRSMLEKIRFSESDNLILAGDYIDRGNYINSAISSDIQLANNVHILEKLFQNNCCSLNRSHG